ncbi:hypothetical protein FC84_GL001620 [Lapidilactobacillus dextrinicus DSM 20335]|uniref:Uncharacterized protein n=1 Tax=Lapidilactobacillus dextrinicus DSM 20335 TaxID=1423738 RepID=A0A0R2BLK2_9LACO|nr:hypothetical protein [Lapidilactobacillus dextrinicus]KRM79442.1 hypothetical protein FC84_GL001620 [Lapidilactobacillus dextrinicus DSM 20335]QFG46724.1 hypothetical protein LH506_04360 [Lapidilactobacillus dextrinicus]
MISSQELARAQRNYDEQVARDCSIHAFSDEEQLTDWNGDIILPGQSYWNVYEYNDIKLPDRVINSNDDIWSWMDNNSFFYDLTWFIQHFGRYGVDETIRKLMTLDSINEVEFFKLFVNCELMEDEN